MLAFICALPRPPAAAADQLRYTWLIFYDDYDDLFFKDCKRL